jgi:solute carrier family 25 carnitine/acylcarnitine transporter 20/29
MHHTAYEAHRKKPDSLNADGLLPKHIHNVHHESLIEEAENEFEELSWSELMFAGGCAGTASWLATFPLDTIKTRIQGMQLKAGEKMPSTLQVTKNIIRTEGWRCLFNGLTPTLIR